MTWSTTLAITPKSKMLPNHYPVNRVHKTLSNYPVYERKGAASGTFLNAAPAAHVLLSYSHQK